MKKFLLSSLLILFILALSVFFSLHMPTALAQVANNYLFLNGNVGIGTSTPASKLDVAGALTIDPGCHPGWVNGSLNMDVCNNVTRIEAGNNTQFPIALNPNGGNVGIGTTNPAQKLDVNGNANITGNLNVTGTINGTSTKSCPAGMVSAGSYCIDSSEQPSATWNSAIDTTFAAGKKLCNDAQFVSAVERGIITSTAAWHWVLDTPGAEYWGGTYYYNLSVVVWGTLGSSANSWDLWTVSHSYRGCIDK